uniref:Laminin N-terminal domain-containing protein n=1 Tax=Glossina palpalis gambiensis TaxID=67801 RepID=A0A1B0ANC9_9MUSC
MALTNRSSSLIPIVLRILGSAMKFKKKLLFFCWLLLGLVNVTLTKSSNSNSNDPCYYEGKSRKCLPSFVNAAYGNPVVASSTCGAYQPERYCELKRDGSVDECRMCDSSRIDMRFLSSALTDLNNPNNVTCWRSAAVPVPNDLDNAPPDNITLTLSLGKKYEITYVSLSFCPKSPKPDSLAIYKSSDFGQTWQPFQFYSSQCQKFYGRPDRAKISKFNEQEARCMNSNQNSNGNRFAFNTLEGRPSANDLDASLVLQDWVTATDIRVIFHRLEPPKQTLIRAAYNEGKADDSSFDDELTSSQEEENDEEEENEEYDYKANDNDSVAYDDGLDDYIEPKKHLELDDDIDLDYANDGTLLDKPKRSNYKHKPLTYENLYKSKPSALTALTTTTIAAPMTSTISTTLKSIVDVKRQKYQQKTSSIDFDKRTSIPSVEDLFAMSQHYAVSDFAVGGRCKCNGHASECIAFVSSNDALQSDYGDGGISDTGDDGANLGRSTATKADISIHGKLTMTCACKHNTAGPECERCKPFYFDRPWGRATDTDANECKNWFLLFFDQTSGCVLIVAAVCARISVHLLFCLLFGWECLANSQSMEFCKIYEMPSDSCIYGWKSRTDRVRSVTFLESETCSYVVQMKENLLSKRNKFSDWISCIN